MARRRNFEVGHGVNQDRSSFLSGNLAEGTGATVSLMPSEFEYYDTFSRDDGGIWADWAAQREGKALDKNYQIPAFNYTPPVVDGLWSAGNDQLSAHHALTMAAHRSLKDSGSLPTHSPSLSPFSAPLVARAIDRGHVLPYPGKDSASAHKQAKYYSKMDPQSLEEDKNEFESSSELHYGNSERAVIHHLEDSHPGPFTGDEPLRPSWTGIKEHSEDDVRQMHQEVKAHIDKIAENNKPEYRGKHVRTHNPDQMRLV